jgi:hypothetical protein
MLTGAFAGYSAYSSLKPYPTPSFGRDAMIDHSLRRKPNYIPKQALDWNSQGKRRESPKQTWRRSVIDDLKVVHGTWPELEHEARARKK